MPDAGPTGPAQPRAARTTIALAAVALALVFAVTLAVIQWRKAAGLAQTDRTRHAVSSAAAGFGSALLTYDYADLDAARVRVLSFASPAFAKTYRPPSASSADAEILRLKVRESARVHAVFLGDVTGDRATAVVWLDTTLQSTAGNRASVAYLQLSLVRQRRAWKVDAAKPINAAA